MSYHELRYIITSAIKGGFTGALMGFLINVVCWLLMLVCPYAAQHALATQLTLGMLILAPVVYYYIDTMFNCHPIQLEWRLGQAIQWSQRLYVPGVLAMALIIWVELAGYAQTDISKCTIVPFRLRFFPTETFVC